jgi:hypothetical protein
MEQLLRLQIFSLIAFTQFLIYMLMIYLSVFHHLIPDFHNFWFQASIFNTFNIFLLTSIIQFIWLIAELTLLLYSAKNKWINGCVILSCCIFIIHIFVLHYAHWQYDEYLLGNIKCDDFLIKKYDCHSNRTELKIKIPTPKPNL